MPLLLPVLTAALLLASPGDVLFVQASALKLRLQPKANAAARQQVPIGTACTVLSLTADGWAQIRCPQGSGFGKLELLATTPPDAAQLLAQGQEPGRPTADALNLLLRAVTLKPQDGPTQKAFRELFWKAEFERLARARTDKDTLKAPREVSFPKSCGDPSACVKAALAPDTELAWQEVHIQGSDVLLAQLFPDGLLSLLSGSLDANKGRVTVQLESLSVPGSAVLQALGAQDVQDDCQVPKPKDGEAVCGYEFEQNCEPDECWGARESCKESAANQCQDCQTPCAGTCGSCRLKCGTHGRKDCVARCIEATRACENKCQEPAESRYGQCEAQYKTCSTQAEQHWERECEVPCARISTCAERCHKKNPRKELMTCAAECAKSSRLPASCSDRCFSRMQ